MENIFEQGDENSGFGKKWWAETTKLINRGSKLFWQKRGYKDGHAPFEVGIKVGNRRKLRPEDYEE